MTIGLDMLTGRRPHGDNNANYYKGVQQGPSRATSAIVKPFGVQFFKWATIYSDFNNKHLSRLITIRHSILRYTYNVTGIVL